MALENEGITLLAFGGKEAMEMDKKGESNIARLHSFLRKDAEKKERGRRLFLARQKEWDLPRLPEAELIYTKLQRKNYLITSGFGGEFTTQQEVNEAIEEIKNLDEEIKDLVRSWI